MIERKDKLKTQAKITKAVINAPLDTMEKIAKKVGVSKSTISRNMKEVEQKGTKDDRIIGVTNTDFELIKLTQGETIRRIKETPEEVTTSDLIKAGAESTKRYMLFRGSATDESGGAKSIIDIMKEIQEGKTL